MTYIDLVTEKGELVRIECPIEHENACYDYIENAMKTGGWFCPNRWDGCKAEYLGMGINRIAMNKIIGLL